MVDKPQKEEKEISDHVDCETRLSDMENNWKRALADYKNLEKRVEEEKHLVIQFSTMLLVSRLLPVLGNLETLSKHVEDEGLRLSLKEFKQILEDEGVKEVDTSGSYDPITMEAVETVEGDEGKVVEVLQKGYLLKDKVLMPARVKVGKGE